MCNLKQKDDSNEFTLKLFSWAVQCCTALFYFWWPISLLSSTSGLHNPRGRYFLSINKPSIQPSSAISLNMWPKQIRLMMYHSHVQRKYCKSLNEAYMKWLLRYMNLNWYSGLLLTRSIWPTKWKKHRRVQSRKKQLLAWFIWVDYPRSWNQLK